MIIRDKYAKLIGPRFAHVLIHLKPRNECTTVPSNITIRLYLLALLEEDLLLAKYMSGQALRRIRIAVKRKFEQAPCCLIGADPSYIAFLQYSHRCKSKRHHTTRLLTSHARLADFPPMQIKAAPRYSASNIPCSASSIPNDASQSTQVKAAPHYSLLTSHARLATFPPMQVKAAPRYSASDIPCSASNSHR